MEPGEQEFSLHRWHWTIANRGVDIVQPDLHYGGGMIRATQVARMAEAAGIQALAIHGRTRIDFYNGAAEYDTIGEVKARLAIPVIANGDIDSPGKARQILDQTGADAVMVGRAAQGRPWLFREINHYLEHGGLMQTPSLGEIRSLLSEHLIALYDFYGEQAGLRVARKHIGWYVRTLPDGESFRRRMNTLESAQEQFFAVQDFLGQVETHQPHFADVFGQAA